MRRVPAMIWRLLALPLTGCSTPELPLPTVTSVSPSEFASNTPPELTVTLEAVLPTEVDLGGSAVRVENSVSVFLGTEDVGSTTLGDAQTLRLPLNVGLAPGVYDVRVRLADGREGQAAQAVTVREPIWLPSSYTFDVIGPQAQDQFFDITVRAEGPGASAFSGQVRLTVSDGRVIPPNAGPFVEGVVVQRIRIRDATAISVQLTATDVQGATGTSNPFVLTP